MAPAYCGGSTAAGLGTGLGPWGLRRFLSDTRRSSMKVYMHYEDSAPNNRCMTAPIKISESEATVEDLIGLFMDKLKTKYTDCEGVSKSDVQLSQDGKVVPRSRYASLVEDVFEEGCDVTVALAPAAKVPKAASPPVAPSPAIAKKSQTDGSAPKKAASKAVKTVEAPAGSTFQGADPAARLLYKQLLTMADDTMAKGMLGRAAELYREVLKVDGRQRGAHLGLGKVAVANQQWPIVIRHLRAALEGKSGKEMKDEEDDEEGDEEGVGSEASTLASGGGANLLYESYWLGKAYAAMDRHAKAVKWLTRASREVGRGGGGGAGVSKDDVSVALATSVFELGQAESAADLLNSVIHVNTKHVDAIAQCARLSARVGKPGDAMTYLLQAIVLDQKHRGVRAELCRLLSLEGGVELLLQSLPPSNESSAAPYAFLATIAKEGGAIGASVVLYRAACRLCPLSASYALNLVHVLEIDANYQAAFEHIKAFLRHQPERRVGTQGLRCQDVLQLINHMDEVTSVPSDEACGMLKFKLEWCVRGSDGFLVTTPLNQDAPTTPTQRVEEEYDSDSLDMLALLFTLVKLLFLHGNALPLLPALLHVIEPTRRCSKVELHQTTIRNENAYYGCIAQLLCVPPARVSPSVSSCSSPPRRPIYVCGDSHALSPAWVPMDILGEPRVLQPALVTGLKHWHLRPETEFYPKKNFYRVVASIPPGADVIFLFGEIDCREGLLVAVEKGRYESLTQGMEHTIAIFIDAALKLVKKYNYKAYIHPIVPVLNETRPIVKAYNAIFQRRVLETQGALRWLDFFDGLLSEDKQKLRPGLELDGTHLHPDYLKMLPAAWEKAVRGE